MRKTYTRRFEWANNEDGDERFGAGWVPLGMRGKLDAGFGLTVAHDTLEHLRIDSTIEQECMAFGVMAWGRGQSRDYFISRDSAVRIGRRIEYADLNKCPYDIAYNMADDLGDFLLKCNGTIDAPRKPAHWIDHDEFFAELRELVFDNIRKRLDGYDGDDPRFNEGDDPAMRTREWWSETLDRMVEWMKIGMRRAEEMYGCNLGPYEFTRMFKQLEDHPMVKYEPAREAYILAVTVDREAGTFKVKYEVPHSLHQEGYQPNHDW